MGLAETVTLDGEVEQGIVWLFSIVDGGRAAELPEEVVIRELNGRFAAWQVRDGLLRLRDMGVTVSASRPHDMCVRRCWSVDGDSWARLRLQSGQDPFEH